MDTDNELATTQSQNKELQRSHSRFISNLNLITGTSKIYTPEQLGIKALEYFEYCNNNPIKSSQLITGGQKAGDIKEVNKHRMYTIEGLCLHIGLNTKYLWQLEEQIKDKLDVDSIRYSNILNHIRDTIRTQRLELAAANELNPLIVSRIEGLKDSVEHSGEIKQTYTSIVFQTRNVEDIQSEDVTNEARSALETL